MKRILPLLTKRLSLVALLLTFFSAPMLASYTTTLSASSVSPSDYSTVTSISSFTLTFSEAVYENTNIEAPVVLYVYDEEDELVATETCTLSFSEDNTVVTATASKEYTDYGTYNLVVAAGGLVNKECYDSNYESGNATRRRSYYFYIEAPYEDVVTCQPEDGSTVSELKEFVITWPNEYYVMLSDEAEDDIYLYGPEGTVVETFKANGEDDRVVSSDGTTTVLKTVTITLDETITDPGDYKLTLPAGLVWCNYGSNLSSAHEFTFTIEGATYDLVPTVTPDPDEDFDPSDGGLSVIKLTFDTDVYLNSDVQSMVSVGYMRTTYDVTVSVDETDSKTVLVTLAEPITDDGTYNLTVQEGAIGDKDCYDSDFTAGHANAYMYTRFYVVTPYDEVVTCNPENGSTVESLQTFTLTWENDEEIGQNYYPDGDIVLYDANNTVVASYGLVDDNGDTTYKDVYTYAFDGYEDLEPNQVTFSFDEAITDAGTYTLVIPAGLMNVNEYYDYSTEQTFTFTIEGATYDLEPTTITPEAYSDIDSSEGLSEIKLTFDTDVYVNPDLEEESLITLGAGRKSYAVTVAIDESDSKTVVVTVTEPITDNGTYTLILEEGAIGDKDCYDSDFTAGHANAYMYTRFYVVTPYDEVVTCNPENGSTVESLQTFTLTWENDEEIGQNYYPDGDIVLYDANNTVVASYGLVDDNGDTTYKDVYTYAYDGYEDLEPNQVTFSFDEAITDAGDYTLVIPAGLMNVNEYYDYSTEQTFTFTIAVDEGISNVNSSNSTLSGDIYTIGGVKVNNATKKGVYIVGGKKVVVK